MTLLNTCIAYTTPTTRFNQEKKNHNQITETYFEISIIFSFTILIQNDEQSNIFLAVIAVAIIFFLLS